MKLIINAVVRKPFNPSDCRWTDSCAVVHEPTGCVFDVDQDGDMYLAALTKGMPSIRDVILAARAAEIFIEEVPVGIMPEAPKKKRRQAKLEWVM